MLEQSQIARLEYVYDILDQNDFYINDNERQDKTGVEKEVKNFNEQLDKCFSQLELNSEHISQVLLQILECSYNKLNSFFSGFLNISEKSLLYSLQSLLQIHQDGVLVIVTPNHSYLKEKLWRINNKISWVAINNQISHSQREKILAHLESGGFKLIFIHPELLHNITIYNVSLLIFDDAQAYLNKLPFQNQLWNVDINQAVIEIKPKTIQIMAPLCTMNSLSNLNEKYQFNFINHLQYNRNIIKSPLTVSRDEDFLQHLVQLLRSPRLFRKSGILIFCSTKYQIEELNLYLLSKGLKSAQILKQYTEQKRQSHFFDFAKGSIDIMIAPSGILFPQGFKNFINLTIHLYVPNTIETFILDINEINPEGNSHVFLNSNNYLNGRNKISQQFITIGSIDSLIKQIYPVIDKKVDDQTDLSTKRISFNLLQKSNQLKISKDTLMEIVNQLYKDKIIQNYYLVPVDFIIKLPNNFDMDDDIIKSLLRCSKRCIQINTSCSAQEKSYRCQMSLLSSDLNITPKQIMIKLKQLQIRKLLTYQICEETIIIEIKIQEVNIESKIITVYQEYLQQFKQKLENYDNLYKLLYASSFQTLDYMWKQVKLKNIDYNTSFLSIFDCNKLESNNLPFSQISSQREKTNFLQDIQVKKFFSYIFFFLNQIIKQSLFGDENQNPTNQFLEKETFASDCLIILQGLDCIGNNFNNWKSSNLWKKYWRYQYELLYQIIVESYESIKVNYPKQLKKKFKVEAE